MNRTCFMDVAVLCVCALSASVNVNATVIDFELTPSGITPTDDANLTTSYIDGTTVVNFGFDTNTADGMIQIDDFAVYEDRIPPDWEHGETYSSYSSGSGANRDRDPDFTAGGEGGSFFLRKPVGHDLTINPFVISYSGDLPSSASGQIWDIDAVPISGAGAEQYTVTALDSSGMAIATIISPLGIAETASGTLDGRPWTFSFNSLSAPISTITILQTKGPTKGFGFDNFSATAAVVPAPPAIW